MNWDWKKHILFPAVSQNTDRLKGGFPYQYLWGSNQRNNSDEAEETQSFNVWFLASEHTHERMWHLNNRTKPGCTQLIRPAKTCICLLHLYKYCYLTVWFSFFWLTHQKGESHVRCVTSHQLWRRQTCIP